MTHEEQIEEISSMILKDGVSPDEQDPEKLSRYMTHAKERYGLPDDGAAELVNEALIYLKLKSGKDFDPLKFGSKFGSGFS